MTTQRALIQSDSSTGPDDLPIIVNSAAALPELHSDYHVIIRVLAVALNPIDYKNITHFPSPGQGVGSDFCGTVEKQGDSVYSTGLGLGTRVCGAVFPYNQRGDADQTPQSTDYGAFSEWIVADARTLLRVPEEWTDLQGAALGGVGWATVAMAMSDESALALAGVPSKPSDQKEPILVYGGATATGTMACQMLNLSGYVPIAMTSTHSASLATEYGAAGTAAYTSPSCSETVKKLAKVPIRHAIDCITSPTSVAACFAAMARTGGRYACLEALDDSWRTRKLIRVKEVMGYEALGQSTQLGTGLSAYSREANQVLFNQGQLWKTELQTLLDAGSIKPHPIRELSGFWDKCILEGLEMLRKGEVRGQKLVVRLSDKMTEPSTK
ncbi:putative zinc binding dehydrogenase [Stachybotrys elegans]|uniref:Zinc binding dehydrogenase n=1 Tax=Stachybotrys elegans TaxID=80388 RepID=A0A8K0ST25_9HYPO|nr:putative zinc binding dehydrogenase [Stachybotrys elegans]